MRAPLAVTASALLVLVGCATDEGPDLEAQIAAIENVGKDFRACEIRASSDDCRFAARDATETTSEVWRAFQEAELLETDESKSAFGIMEGWSRWQIRCDGEPNEYALWCVTNAPNEESAKRAAGMLRSVVQA